MYIGEISKKTGVSIKAIRFYEEQGLLFGVTRSGRYRVFNETHIFLIQCIMQAKALGFKLAEIKHAFSHKDDQEPWLHILKMIEHKQQSLSEEIQLKKDQKKALFEFHAQIKLCLSNKPHCRLEDNI
jgi:DNA-binding transcriptional MerR regulator